MSICVIYNPVAGRRQWESRLRAVKESGPRPITFFATERRGHAVELAEQACRDGFAVVAAAGGDGTVHEVANGILRWGGSGTTMAVLPYGSANDYAHSVRRQFGTSTLSDDDGNEVDVGIVESDGRKTEYFVECLGLGLSALVTLESRKIRRLRGLLLYGLAAWRALRQQTQCNSLSIQWDEKPAVTSPTLMLSFMLGRREGHFVMAPTASLDDGLFDTIHAGPVGRWEALRMLPGLALYGPPSNHPRIAIGQCHSANIEAQYNLAIHVDGEMFCTLDDALNHVTIRLLPKKLRVKVCAAP